MREFLDGHNSFQTVIAYKIFDPLYGRKRRRRKRRRRKKKKKIQWLKSTISKNLLPVVKYILTQYHLKEHHGDMWWYAY